MTEKPKLGAAFEYGGKRVGDQPGPRYWFREFEISGRKFLVRESSELRVYDVVESYYDGPIVSGSSWDDAVEKFLKLEG